MTAINGADKNRLLRLLLFSAAGTRFGADADQIESICDFPPDAEVENTIRLAEKPVCRHGLATGSPLTVLKVRGKKVSYLVAVDRVEEIVEIGIGAIRPLPKLILPYTIKKGIWGAFPRGNELLLLIDFTRLPEGDNHDAR